MFSACFVFLNLRMNGVIEIRPGTADKTIAGKRQYHEDEGFVKSLSANDVAYLFG